MPTDLITRARAAETPRRIQRKRTKGWKMPPNTVSVTRPGKWGNPFVVGGWFLMGDPDGRTGSMGMIWTRAAEGYQDSRFTRIADAAMAVEWFERLLSRHPKDLTELRGKNLACFCPEGSPCHGDVLLRLANGEAAGQTGGEVGNG